MKRWLWYIPIVVLVVLHQDNWWWDDKTLVLGFMPIGLFWHALISLGAGLAWWLVVRCAWPHELDEGEEAPVTEARAR